MKKKVLFINYYEGEGNITVSMFFIYYLQILFFFSKTNFSNKSSDKL